MGATLAESGVDLDSMRGSTLPRLFPKPLVSGPPGPCGCGCALTDATSYGFSFERFVINVLWMKLTPWERWIAIHAGELKPNGRPRFRKILLIVARQNGKTFLLVMLTLFWMFAERWRLIVGQHTKLSKAKEVWEEAFSIASKNAFLKEHLGYIRKDNNDPHWKNRFDSKYVPEAANENGGRGGSTDRGVIDELRQHRTWAAWNAIKPTINARPYGQLWLISNQGDMRSIVLLALRRAGLANLGITGEMPDQAPDDIGDEADPELGLFEWSAPPGSSMTDPAALCMANPNANHPDGVSLVSLLADARGAMKSGDAEMVSTFKTEIMCMYVPAMDNAIDPAGWEKGAVLGTLDQHRSRLVLVPELSPDGLHSSLTVAAPVEEGRYRVEVVASWSGKYAASALRRELPAWVGKIRPRKLAWMPGGPAAAIGAELAQANRFPGTEIERVSGELPAICMGFAEMVSTGHILHSPVKEQELLSTQTLGSEKLWRGPVWVFSRKGKGHCDTTYGAALGVHVARTMPAPLRYEKGSLRSGRLRAVPDEETS